MFDLILNDLLSKNEAPPLLRNIFLPVQSEIRQKIKGILDRKSGFILFSLVVTFFPHGVH